MMSEPNQKEGVRLPDLESSVHVLRMHSIVREVGSPYRDCDFSQASKEMIRAKS